MAAACVLMMPVIGGCVSAVDETSSFGFAPTASSTSTASALKTEGTAGASPETDGASKEDTASIEVASDADPAAPDTDKAVTPDKQVAALAASETGRKLTDTADAAVEAEATGGIRPTALMTRTSAPAVAAYATPNPGGKVSDTSLYASLFTQADPKTPLKNAEAGKSRRVVVLQTQGSNGATGDSALPGVDPKSLFEIGQRASADSDLMDDIGGSYQIASLSGIARLAPSGLMIQREDVVTNCFDSDLMGMISQIENRFRQKVVITSGFRSPAHNRRVNGAKASMHMACKAADLHVPGANGLEVARFVRALPNRGGVGTYCHTAAIHVDVGTTRDWNWPCRTRRMASVKQDG